MRGAGQPVGGAAALGGVSMKRGVRPLARGEAWLFSGWYLTKGAPG